MNNQASNAIENGLISQLIPSVTAMPRQWRPTWRKAAGSMRMSIGTIISHTSTAIGMLIWAMVARPMAWKGAGSSQPSAIPPAMQRATQTVR